MKNLWILARRDGDSYLYSLAGVLIFAFFMLISGVFFCLPLLGYARLSVAAGQALGELGGVGLTRFVFSAYFMNLGAVLIFLVPFLTMRSFAEERSMQTLELLFTYPLTDLEIVLGKFLAVFTLFILLVVPTGIYLAFLFWTGAALDWGPIVSGYLGFILLGTAYLSFGLFVSSLAENQVVSTVVTFGGLVVFWVLEWIANSSDGAWAKFLSALSPFSHYRDFTLGILDFSHAVYFLFFFLYFLFLTLRSVEIRNWKG